MKITINDFRGGMSGNLSDNLASLTKSVFAYNVEFKTGALKACGVFEPLKWGFTPSEGASDSLPISPKGFCGGCVFNYKKYEPETNYEQSFLLLFDAEFNGYYLELSDDDNAEWKPMGIKFNARPLGVNYNLNGEDVFILVSPKDNMVVWKGGDDKEVVVDAPKITSLALHYERLFVTESGDKFKLSFSDELDPTNWSVSVVDAGEIKMLDERGALTRVISFNDYVYVFRERGISRVYANTVSQDSFYVNHLFTAGGEIAPRTVTVCGDKIFFVATDGIYTFDGGSVVRRNTELFPFIESVDNASACYHNGCYYLSCRVKDFGGNGNNAIVVIDGEDYSYKILRPNNKIEDLFLLKKGGKESLGILTSDGEFPLYRLDGVKNAQVESVFKTGLKRVLNNKPRFVVRKVGGVVTGNAEIMLFNEKGEKSEPIKLSSDINECPVLFGGKKLGFEVKLFVAGETLEQLTLVVV